jgi:hypothetical protein
MFEHFGIRVVAGVAGQELEAMVKTYLAGSLATNGELCSGGHLHACGDHEKR